jgi:hypothetical protein
MLSLITYGLILMVLIYWVEAPSRILPNSLIIKKNPAQELENWLKKFNWKVRQEAVDLGALPHYKFYTEIVELLLNLSRKLGGTYEDSVIFLREGLQFDRQSEKKLKDMIIGTWLQMGLMVVLTWTFIICALWMIDVKVSGFRLMMIALWQGLGLSFLPMLLSYFRKLLFSDIGKLWKMFFVLRSLSRVPVSRSEVMNMAGVAELKNIQQKSLLHMVEKLKDTCQRALQMGGSYEEDVLSLMAELRFQEKWHFELFEKRLMVIKLGLLAIFFLPSYLAFIFLLLGDLMTLM